MNTHLPIFSVLVSFSLGASIPDVNDFAGMARYIVHNSDTCHMSTIATLNGFEGYPFSNARTVSDGADLESSTGALYFYTSTMDLSSLDLAADNRCSLSFTLAETYCKEQDWIAQDPRCPRLLVTGKMVIVEGEEKEVAKAALFGRYPIMEFWPEDHGFTFTKVVPEILLLLDQFGGAANIAIDDYFDAATPEMI